jgi:hypothetical protein
MRLAHVIAALAGLVGVAAVGMGLWGFNKFEFIEWAMTMGKAFDNPEHGNITADEWRAGFKASMTIFLSFGVAALVAAYGLFRGKRWAEYLWLVLVAVAVSTAIFIASFLIFRTGRRLSAAP